ncbi:MAG: hypothetical protein K2Q18_19700 [Bdellovibrionales bacterium]|nr:hypothetical protein [Bdellovibrionales bacterium]
MKKIIALLTLTVSITAMADTTNYKCFGTEPFWDFKIKENQTVFNEMFEDETKTETILSRVTAANVGDNTAFVVKTKSTTATVVAGACSDGMSDETYSHHIVLENDTSVLYGCCNESL